MPTYAIIRPKEKTVEITNFQDYKDAVRAAGLEIGALDFGTLLRFADGGSLSIIVSELGLIKGDPEGYFALSAGLFNGNAILFAANEEGETVDLPHPITKLNPEGQPHLSTHINWLGTAQAAEEAILAGKVNRPEASVNGKTLWTWTGN